MIKLLSQPSGDDQTAALNAILADPNNNGIDLTFDTSTVIIISGTLQARKKLVNFGIGTIIKGGGTINQAVIDFVDYRQQIFDTSITLTGCRTASKKFTPMLYGAKADGVQDDQPYLQKTSDMMIANTDMDRNLLIPYGTYLINSPWMLYSFVSGEYRQWNLNVIGEEEIQSANNSSNPRIMVSANCDFGIGVQRAAGGYIKGLSIEGSFRSSISQTQFYLSKFSDVSNLRNTPFSPNSGIVIDPYCYQIPADGGYQNSLAWYRGSAVRSGCSDFHIYECRVQGFTVDIMNSPNGVTQQGEDCSIENCDFNYCNVAVAYGNTQSDNTKLLNTRLWYYIFCGVDNWTYGNSGVGGTISKIEGMNVASTVKKLFNISINQKTLLVKDIYCENLYDIGLLQSVNAEIHVDGMYVNFAGISLRPQFNGSFANTVFTACTFRYYDDQYNKRMIFNNGYNTRFVNVFFDQPPLFINPNLYYSSTPEFVNCLSFDPTAGRKCNIGYHNSAHKLSNAEAVPLLYGTFTLQDFTGLNSSDMDNNSNLVAPYSTVSYSYSCPTFNRYVRKIATGVTLSIDSVNRKATFISPLINQTHVNDYCIDAATGFNLGRITAIAGNTITISEIPDNIKSGTYTIDLVYYLTISRPFVGDIQAGSNKVTNFAAVFTAPYCSVGDRIESPFFPMGTYVAAYDYANKIVTLSCPSNTTATKVTFANGNPREEVRSLKAPTDLLTSGFPFAFLEGTRWTQINLANPVTWIFNKGGTLASGYYFSNKADYNKEVKIRMNGKQMQYFDQEENQWEDYKP